VAALLTWLPVVSPLYAEDPCEACREAAQQESANCVAGAISQEDTKSCIEKEETRSKACQLRARRSYYSAGTRRV